MKKIYTIEDVKEMLESKGYKWSGYFYDERRTRLMTNEYLWNNENFQLGTVYNDLTTLRIFTINEFEFIRGVNLLPNRDDWTTEWHQLLLDKYPEYASMLLKHAESKIHNINTNLFCDTNTLIERMILLKKNADIEKGECVKMQILAKKYIEQNETKQLEKKLEDFKADLSEDMKGFTDNL